MSSHNFLGTFSVLRTSKILDVLDFVYITEQQNNQTYVVSCALLRVIKVKVLEVVAEVYENTRVCLSLRRVENRQNVLPRPMNLGPETLCERCSQKMREIIQGPKGNRGADEGRRKVYELGIVYISCHSSHVLPKRKLGGCDVLEMI